MLRPTTSCRFASPQLRATPSVRSFTATQIALPRSTLNIVAQGKRWAPAPKRSYGIGALGEDFGGSLSAARARMPSFGRSATIEDEEEEEEFGDEEEEEGLFGEGFEGQEEGGHQGGVLGLDDANADETRDGGDGDGGDGSGSGSGSGSGGGDGESAARQKTVFEKYTPFCNNIGNQMLYRTTIKMGRHCKIIAGGRVYSYSALVLIGNGDGVAGLGYGKALAGPEAIVNATKDAEKNLVPIYRYKGNTIKEDLVAKYVSTKVIIKARRPGRGIKASRMNYLFLQHYGLDDVSVKVHGSRNPTHVFKALMKAVSTNLITDEEMDHRGHGTKMMNVNSMYVQGPDQTQRMY